MSTKTCRRCGNEKNIKAEELCDACYTATCRENANKKKVNEEEDSLEEGKSNVQELMRIILKQQDENLLLRQKLEMSQNALPTTKYDGNGESLQSTHTEGVP